MKGKTTIIISLLILCYLIPIAYASDEDKNVDINDFPSQLADRLNISLNAAELLASTIVIVLFSFPSMMIGGYFGGKDAVSFALFISVVPTMAFCIIMGWLDIWVLLLLAMLIALMYSGKARGFIGGGE